MKENLFNVLKDTDYKVSIPIQRRIDIIIDTMLSVYEGINHKQFIESYIYANILIQNTLLHLPKDIGVDYHEIYEFLDNVFYDYLVDYYKTV